MRGELRSREDWATWQIKGGSGKGPGSCDAQSDGKVKDSLEERMSRETRNGDDRARRTGPGVMTLNRAKKQQNLQERASRKDEGIK